MKICIPIMIIAMITSTSYAENKIPGSVECDSFMKWGFSKPNEHGVFRYSNSPLKISVSVDNKNILITDTTTFCHLPIGSNYGKPTFSTSAENDGTWINLFFKATRGVLKDDVGSLQINESDLEGIFTCPDFDMPDDVALSNCKIQN